jgi:hypothetical protein
MPRANGARWNGSADNPANEPATTVLLVDERAWTREALACGLEVASRDLRVLGAVNRTQVALLAEALTSGPL